MNDGCVSCIYTVEAVMVAVIRGPAGYGSDGDVLTATLSNSDSPANSCGGATLCQKFLHTGEFGLIAILLAFGTGNTQLIDLPRSLPRGALKVGEKYQGSEGHDGRGDLGGNARASNAADGPKYDFFSARESQVRHDAPHTAAHAGRGFAWMQIANSVAIWLQVLQTGVISATVLLIAPRAQGSLSLSVSQLVDVKTFEMAAER
ncbi:hypothetical protein FB451DRAFT_1190388 [Mycena latifolia]|nr:hypothetical protein FB451DRAFT_1190388 [Mycena latifolia]